MNTIEMTRELGKLLQQEEAYKNYHAARIRNDEDEALQDMIGEFNLKRVAINQEVSKPDKDEEKIKRLDGEMRAVYTRIMENENMQHYNEAKQEFDALMNQIKMILTLSANGEDPATCEASPSCSGSCDSCAGCH